MCKQDPDGELDYSAYKEWAIENPLQMESVVQIQDEMDPLDHFACAAMQENLKALYMVLERAGRMEDIYREEMMKEVYDTLAARAYLIAQAMMTERARIAAEEMELGDDGAFQL